MEKNEETSQFNEILRKIERNNGVFSRKIEETIHLKKELQVLKESLQIEVTELQATRGEIEDTIKETTKRSHPELTRLMSNSLNEKFQELSRPLKETTTILNSSYKKQETKLRKIALYVGFSILSSSTISGWGLWYFFPQTEIFQIEFSSEQRRQMEYGALLQFALPKMPKKEQDKIWSLMGDSWKEYYEKMLGRKFK